MTKAGKAKGAVPASKPKVVFDVKMPQYQYRQGEDKSLSVDRKRVIVGKPMLDCLANLKV